MTFVGAILPTPLHPLFREAFGFSPVTLTLVYAVYVLGNLVALLLFGRLADQIGRRNTALPAIGFGSLPLPAPHGCSRRGRSADFRRAWQPAPPPHGSPKPMSTAAPEARIAAAANFFRSAAGPLIGGTLAQLATAPLRLPFFVYLALLCTVAVPTFLCRRRWPRGTD